MNEIDCCLPGNEVVEGRVLHRGAALLTYAPFTTPGYDFLDVVSGDEERVRGRAVFVVRSLALRSAWVSSSVFAIPNHVFSDRVLTSPVMQRGTFPDRLLDIVAEGAPAAWKGFFGDCVLPSLFCVLRHSLVDTGYVLRFTVNSTHLPHGNRGQAFLEDFLRRLSIAHGVVLTAPLPYCALAAS